MSPKEKNTYEKLLKYLEKHENDVARKKEPPKKKENRKKKKQPVNQVSKEDIKKITSKVMNVLIFPLMK